MSKMNLSHVCIDNFLLNEMNSHEYLQNIGIISVVQFC